MSKSIKFIVLAEMLSPSKAVKILKREEHQETMQKYFESVAFLQECVNKRHIVNKVQKAFNEFSEAEFVMFLDSQLPESQRGKILGGNILEKIQQVCKRAKLA